MTENDYDLYELLGVAHGAPGAVITAAWRALAKTAHPDAGGDTAEFQRLEHAYSVLSDPSRRADYDGSRRTETGGTASTSTAGRAKEDAHFWSDFDDASERLRAERAARSCAEADDHSEDWRHARAAADARAGEEMQRLLAAQIRLGRRAVPMPDRATWPLVWRFGLLGAAFCSVSGSLLVQVPRLIRPYPAPTSSGVVTGLAMLTFAVGVVAMLLRVRRTLLTGWASLLAIYGSAGTLTTASLLAGGGYNAFALFVGAIMATVGTRSDDARHVLLGSGPRRSRPEREPRRRRVSVARPPAASRT